MDLSNRIQLPRFRILSFMIGAAVVAVVFGTLRSIPKANPAESTFAVIFVVSLLALVLLFLSLRPDPVTAVLADPPKDPDELRSSLEQGLLVKRFAP